MEGMRETFISFLLMLHFHIVQFNSGYRAIGFLPSLFSLLASLCVDVIPCQQTMAKKRTVHRLVEHLLKQTVVPIEGASPQEEQPALPPVEQWGPPNYFGGVPT